MVMQSIFCARLSETEGDDHQIGVIRQNLTRDVLAGGHNWKFGHLVSSLSSYENSIPPLMSIFAPVMKALSSQARKRARFAVSSVLP